MPAEAPTARLTVALPEPTDRRMRLGPFPSVGQALKFAGYASFGAVAAALAGPAAWLPCLGVGFVAATVQPGGKAPDERALDYLAYQLRRRARPPSSRRGAVPFGAQTVTTPLGQLVALLAVGGVPIAFLPPAESRRLFDGYRRLLATTDATLYACVGLVPLRDRPFRPTVRIGDRAAADGAARQGYDELVRAVARSRARRRVLLTIAVPGPAETARVRLEAATRRLTEALLQLELRVDRLEGEALEREAARLGLLRGGR